MYTAGKLPEFVFFTGNWAGRGRAYRELVEPLDIANYYKKNKHVESGHYADGISDETRTDNNKRPGRYMLLQAQELRAFTDTMPKSSLDKARQFKELLGDVKWEQVVVREYFLLFQTVLNL